MKLRQEVELSLNDDNSKAAMCTHQRNQRNKYNTTFIKGYKHFVMHG